MNRRITHGGRATIIITIIWAFNVLAAVARAGYSDVHAAIAGILSFPLCLLGGGAGFLSRRGLMQLDELYTLLILMIPNAFLLGYGIVGLCKAIVPYESHKGSSLGIESFRSTTIRTPNKSRHDNPS